MDKLNKEYLDDWLKRYKSLTNIIYDSEDELSEIERDINSYVNNPSCHGLFGKSYLDNLEKKKDKLKIILLGLECLRDKMRDEDDDGNIIIEAFNCLKDKLSDEDK